jgi:hypothetical protein
MPRSKLRPNPMATVLFGQVMRDLASQFLALAEKQGAKIPIMIGHRLMASSMMGTGDIVEGRKHYDRAMALYDNSGRRVKG